MHCKICIHAELDKTNGSIQCRYNPPQNLLIPGPPTVANPTQGTLQIMGVFPVVAPDSWCSKGEAYSMPLA